MNLIFSLFLIFNTSIYSIERVSSGVPTATEIIYDLELDDKLISVTPYCNYPEDVSSKKKLQLYSKVDFEKLLKIQSQAVIVSSSISDKNSKFIKDLGIDVLKIKHFSVQDIFDSYMSIGDFLGEKKKSMDKIKVLKNKIKKIKKSDKKLKVLVVIGADPSFTGLKTYTVAGRKTYYDDLLSILNLENAISSEDISYPILNYEKLIKINPDVILHLLSEDTSKKDLDNYSKLWKKSKSLKAIRNNMFFILNKPYSLIPGPRMIESLRDISTLVVK